MDAFVPKMKRKYIDRLVNREKQWPPCHSNKIVRLQLVEREKGEGYCANIQRGREDKTVKRTPLAYGDLFKVEKGKKPVRKILVEGDAGIGMTTLSISLSEDWACEKLFQEFELLLLLQLRHKTVASAGSLPELLKLLHPSSDVCKAVASYVENEEEKVLIIADGWDELCKSDQQEGSVLYELLFETFPLMSVVVTSRPSASAPLHRLPCIDRFVEISGFSKEDIKEYIESEFTSDQEKASRLLEQLEDNPLVESVCSIPLNCSIMCHLWRTLEEGLPSTMTQLYTKILLNVILRNIQKKDAFKNVLSLSNFNALPKDLQQSFKLLCGFAFQALKNNQIVFSQEALVEFFPEGLALDEKILCFGLLQSAETVLETGHGVSFHFIHLTFMEYLAALHLVEQPQSTQLQVFNQEDIAPFSTSGSTMIWRFYFGLVFSLSKKLSSDILTRAIEFVRRTCTWFDLHLPLYHCAFEAQKSFIARKVIRLTSTRSVNVSFGDPHTAHDCAAVLQIIANTEECHCMDIKFINCGVREKQIRTLTDILASKKGKLQVNLLNLSGNKPAGECLSDLLQRASVAFRPNTKPQPINELHVLTVPCSRGIRTLILSDNSLGVCDLQTLEHAVCGKLFLQLSHLSLNKSLTNDANTNDEWLTTFMDALSNYCPYLQFLELSHNNLGVAGASAIGRGVSLLKSSSFGLWVLLNNTILDLEAFFDSIKRQCLFYNLNLSGNNIHAAGVSYLADAVCSGKIIFDRRCSILDLSYNPLELNGTIAVSKMLSNSYCWLRDVDLSKCKLTQCGDLLTNIESLKLQDNNISSQSVQDVVQQLCLLPKNHTVESLNLNGTGEGFLILAGIMHLCSSLKRLSCCDCGITSDDLILLCEKLTQLKTSCNNLESWNLANNSIDDNVVSFFSSHLSSLFPKLEPGHISFYNNPISKELMTKLKELGKGRDLRELLQKVLPRQLHVSLHHVFRQHMKNILLL